MLDKTIPYKRWNVQRFERGRDHNMIMSTQRLQISHLVEADLNDAVTLYTNHKVRRYLGGVITQEKAFVRLRESMQSADEYIFVVRLRVTDELLGLVYVHPYHEEGEYEVSWMFLPQHWSNGYARESVTALLGYCKEKLKLRCVVSETQVANEPSRRLIEGLGYRVLRKCERFGAAQVVYVIDLI